MKKIFSSAGDCIEQFTSVRDAQRLTIHGDFCSLKKINLYNKRYWVIHAAAPSYKMVFWTRDRESAPRFHQDRFCRGENLSAWQRPVAAIYFASIEERDI